MTKRIKRGEGDRGPARETSEETPVDSHVTKKKTARPAKEAAQTPPGVPVPLTPSCEEQSGGEPPPLVSMPSAQYDRGSRHATMTPSIACACSSPSSDGTCQVFPPPADFASQARVPHSLFCSVAACCIG